MNDKVRLEALLREIGWNRQVDRRQDRLARRQRGGEAYRRVAADGCIGAEFHVGDGLVLRRRHHGVDCEDREELVCAWIVSLRGRVYRDPD